ncbi:formate dehydrogenase subunit alpha [Priestia endophytica]|uniref:Formate dehydrogenase subunit alpha n=1 Tax=Priestia endophytica TaxID=135735 RepID=A0AAX1Q7N5_9BACI|nr:formate dehydrogenase subunit alpha [Priestia endophytica]RAS76154.1 formate dehydrogenase subunit alpha [Priestia endophytica]RAS85352.1 formate dehydrogenase subunit alpha [Priestia endophytica]
MEKTVAVTINGEQHKVQQGTRLLDYLLAQNIPHPHVCYSETLGPIQTCDTCMCEINGDIMRACSTEAKEGMEILTSSERAKAYQKEAMDRLLENHLLYCTVCDNNNGNCRVHNTAEQLEIEHQTRPFREKGYEKDHSHPFYRYDPDQCILCGRCVEVCQDVQVNETLTIDWERKMPRVLWDNGKSINESSCVSCGQCVTVCPCNALMEKSMIGEAGFLTGMSEKILDPMIDLVKEVEPDYKTVFALSEVEAAAREKRTKKTKTVCTFCGVGCSFEVWTKGREILKIEPTEQAPVNSISTCIKGKFGWDFVNSDERLTTPLIRKGDQFVRASWNEALTLIGEKLTFIKEKYGGDALGFVSSSKTTNEEAYLMQKLARQVFETNNVDNCSRYCQSPATNGLLATVGYGGDSGTIQDIENAGLVITIGANPTEGHPVLATRVKSARKLRGQKLIVADLRKHELAERSDLFLRPKQGTDYVWLTALAKYMIDKGWHNEKFIRERIDNYEEYIELLDKYTLDYASEVTGLSKETLHNTAKMIYEADGTCILWGMGVTQNIAGSHTSGAIVNLLLVTGNFGRTGTGAYPLRGHNNVQGSCDMGALPQSLPGNEPLTDDEARQRFEEAYGVSISKESGLTNVNMLVGAQAGSLKGIYLIGEDMALVDANAEHVQDALSNLDFFVVQDLFFTKTAQFADVILPASPSLEKDGTFTNTERRIQRLYQAIEPLEDSKPDWWIIQEIANRCGAQWNYHHPSDIMDEIARLCPNFAGVSYERLEGWKSLVWPVQHSGKDEPLLYTKRFNFPDGKARFSLKEYVPPLQFPKEYDLTLNNGRLLEQFHVGNMTNKSKGIQYKLPEVFVEVSPHLAAERGIKDGSLVRLRSPYGAIKLHALITDRVEGNELYVPMHSVHHENAVNLLTGTAGDLQTQTPAYKQTKVKMDVLAENGEKPLPSYNHRYAKRHPQLGVEVERKWKRDDYEPIADQNEPVRKETNVKGGV